MGPMSLALLILTATTTVYGQRTVNRAVELVDISLYNGNNIDELLSLCYYPNSMTFINQEDFEEYYAATVNPGVDANGIPLAPSEPRCPTLDVGVHSGMSDDDVRIHLMTRFEDLRRVQTLIRDYHRIISTTHNYPVLILLVFCICAGVLLVATGHYHWRCLVDSFHTDGSYGVPCWQYLRMRYVAAKVRGGTTKTKTLLVPIFDKAKSQNQKLKGN